MLAVAVLAAGKGTRMRSAHPKVLQPLAGATLVDWVLQSCEPLDPHRCLMVVGHQAERVQQHVQGDHRQVEFVLQQPQRGTGHSVQQLLEPLAAFTGTLLVLNGDAPLLRSATLAAGLSKKNQTCCEPNGNWPPGREIRRKSPMYAKGTEEKREQVIAKDDDQADAKSLAAAP